MVVSSVLVAGGGVSGCVSAATLAQRGFEVALVDRAPDWSHEGPTITLDTDPGVLLRELGVGEAAHSALVPALAMRLQELAIEVRSGTQLLGCVAVDRHVEAELSDGRIENYDLIVVAAGDRRLRLVASDDILRSRAVDAIRRTLDATS